MVKEQDAKRFTEIMLGLAENFGTELSNVGLKLRFEALKAYSINQVEAAALDIMRSRKFTSMPTVAEFIERIDGQAPSIEHKATAEANRIIAHLHTYGATTWPDFSADQITQRLMTTRWPYKTWASQVLESELKWWVKEFVQAYEAEQISSGRPAQIPAQLRGLIENIGGGKEGFNNSLPV